MRPDTFEPGCRSAGSESHGWGVSCFRPSEIRFLASSKSRYHDVQLLVQGQHFARVSDAAPRDVRDVQQTVDTAEVDEHAEVGHVLDVAFQNLTFLEVVQDGLTLLLEVFLDEYFVRNHHVVESGVDFHHFHFHATANINVEVADGLHVDLRAGQEGFYAVELHDEAAFGATLHYAFEDGIQLEGIVNSLPGLLDFSFLAAQDELAVDVFLVFDEHLHRRRRFSGRAGRGIR